MKNIARPPVWMALATGLVSFSSFAQTPPAAPTKEADDVVHLSEFTVSAGSTKGYVASESMTGTRVATQIKDLPFTVNILTSEFFKDFAFFELNENVAYISSFSNLDQGGGYNLRGFNQSYQLRDGFFRLGRYGTSNVDRIEVIKGPNASIYGQSQPGGMINMISKSPKKKTEQSIAYSFGSYDTSRVTAEATGSVGSDGKTYYIADYGYYDREFDRAYSVLRNKEYYLAVRHDFTDATNLLFSIENFSRHQGSPVNQVPELYDPTGNGGTGLYTGMANQLADFNQNGPNSYQDRNALSLTGTLATELNSIFSVRIGTNYGHYKNTNLANTNSAQYNIVTNSLARGVPARGLIDEVTLNIQADLLAHWYLMNRKIENRDLLTFDLADYYRYDPTRNLANGIPRGTTSIIVGQPIDFYVPPYNLTNYSTTTRWRHNRATDWGTLYRHQSTFMDDRLLTYFSLRYDEVKLRMRNYVGVPANAPVILNDNLQNWSPSAGVLYKATSHLSPYVSWSTGFNPLVQNQDAKAPLPAETAKGWDYGVKAAFLQDRLNFTLGGYYITRENVVVTVTDSSGNSVNESAGSQLVRGIEFDSNWRVMDNFTVGATWGHVDSRITNDGFRYMSIGRSAPRLAPDNVGVYGRYEWINGALKGLSVNLGVTYSGPSKPENFNAGDTYALDPVTKKQVFVRSNNQWALTIPGYVVWNGGIRYHFRPENSHFAHEIGFNVNNVFDKFYISTARTKGDTASYFLSYSITH